MRYRDTAKDLQVEFRSYHDSEGKIILECIDNGLGMDLNRYGNKLFDLYATFHPGISSRGAGLYVIKTQIESQGGKIIMVSKPGEGSTFQITFPVNNT